MSLTKRTQGVLLWGLMLLGACANDLPQTAAGMSNGANVTTSVMGGAGSPAVMQTTVASPVVAAPVSSTPAAAVSVMMAAAAGSVARPTSASAGSSAMPTSSTQQAAAQSSAGGAGGAGGAVAAPSTTMSTPPADALPDLSMILPPPSTPETRIPAADNPAECPSVAPENPVGDCLGLPVYVECRYGTYTCVCDWYHWLCAG